MAIKLNCNITTHTHTHTWLLQILTRSLFHAVQSIVNFPLSHINKDKDSQVKRKTLQTHALSKEMPFLLYDELFTKILALKNFTRTSISVYAIK